MIFTVAKDHFIVWPSSVTLNFNIPEQLFQMNSCANIFSKSMHKYRSYVLDKLYLWLFYHLTF